MNTVLEKHDNDKWIGMENHELHDYFSSYAAVEAVKHSYGPRGHRGTSVMVFEATSVDTWRLCFSPNPKSLKQIEFNWIQLMVRLRQVTVKWYQQQKKES
ncbi:hypothetical protein RND71_023490 [Anisodus tanguticus]|uniref:XS domain-containing protein n=1 Tax=Anisodus tanguticus TaxID=243964 RepID=A0AAE1VET2_9SOLA|nr:hypothetical protein RND71_023490 [Anisodus tanguticus]